MKMLGKALTSAAAVAALGGGVIAVTGTAADAAGRNGKCDTGEFCLYYNSNQKGSLSDFTTSVSNYGAKQPGCYDFKSAGAGKGKCVKNSAASVWNRSSKTVRVYFNSNYGGRYQDFKAGAKGNLNSGLKNQNASHSFGVPKPGTGQTPRNDYDHNARGFAQNNCTAFAAYRIASRLGVRSFNNHWKTTWGNAGMWDNAARRVGVKVDKTPKVGAIAVNDVHKVGHVAYVNKVYSDGSFDVEEYNWNTPLHYGTRHHIRVSNAQSAFQWMLHF
ncbi:CHAP domain-containing protein [Spirillospora sp. NPDC052269]